MAGVVHTSLAAIHRLMLMEYAPLQAFIIVLESSQMVDTQLYPGCPHAMIYNFGVEKPTSIVVTLCNYAVEKPTNE